MGLCGNITRYLLYVTIPLAAVLVFFHLECSIEKKWTFENKFNDEYNPAVTECSSALYFINGDLLTIKFGPEWFLVQWIPCSVSKLVGFISMRLGIASDYRDLNMKMENITIMDARKQKLGPFEETGFSIISLKEESGTKNWRPGSEDIHLFREQIAPHLMKLYPQTKRIQWFSNLIRGGDQFGDQPRAMGPHLDYHQDDEERKRFYEEHSFPEFLPMNQSEVHAMVGRLDTEDEKLGVILGLWKPLSPSEICDYPLAVMDAQTFRREEQIRYHLHMNTIFNTFNNLNAAIRHHPDQRWYYYSRQTTSEVLVFHQYSKGKWLANPHTSFLNKNCPKGTEKNERISAEMRVGLYF